MQCLTAFYVALDDKRREILDLFLSKQLAGRLVTKSGLLSVTRLQ